MTLPASPSSSPFQSSAHRACSSNVGAVLEQQGEDFLTSTIGSNMQGGGVGEALEGREMREN